MKNFNLVPFIIFSVTILSSCDQKPSAKPDDQASPHSYSDSYKAPAFDNDDRINKIKKIAPELQQLIEMQAKAENIPGIAYGIVVDNELLVSGAAGYINLEKEIPASPASYFRIASMTKSFTAMAIIMLRDEGKLSLSDPVSKYIPEMSELEYLSADAPVIDIENLLTMTAGFPEDNPWGDRQLDEPDQMLIDLISEGVSFSNIPSYAFEYSNTGYALLGNIISRVSGMPYELYITQNILKPLGMEHSYWEYDSVPEEQLALGYRWEDEAWKPEPMLHDGSFGAMGGLITSIEDFRKYVSFHLSAWPPRNQEETGPIKRSSVREMQTPQFSGLNSQATDFSGNPCAQISGYGYGLFTEEYCDGLKIVTHSGALPGFGSEYYFFPEYGVGIMAFCNLTYTSPWPYQEIGKLIFETAGIEPRQLPVSEILQKRQVQFTQLMENWEGDLETEILAENFYLDRSRDKRIEEVKEIMEQAGPRKDIYDFVAYNQLRCSYKIRTENGFIFVYFTLTPEKDPKVQEVYMVFQAEDQ